MRFVERLGGIQMIMNTDPKEGLRPEYLSLEQTEAVRHFHESLKGYAPTPLVSLSGLAQKLGVGSIYVKDESKRFGQNAFKGLGGTYAMFRVICSELGLDHSTATLEQLQTADYQKEISKMVFVTATDGNHGKGISWAAGLFGCKAYIYMPQGSVEVRAQAIRSAGPAEVTITDMTYDDTVRYAAGMAAEKGWYLIQDTSWEGYETIPQWIIQGYTTMVYEALQQMQEMGHTRPTHVFLQAGVGAMAGGVLGALCCTYGDRLPAAAIVEPEEVACIFESAHCNDGAVHKAIGSEITIMAGLNCAEPCQITWPILRDFASFYFACPDTVAAHGMRTLASPVENDQSIISGESGAPTTGLLALLLEQSTLLPFCDKLGLNEESVVLLLNTEGDTDPQGYAKVVNSGAYTYTINK